MKTPSIIFTTVLCGVAILAGAAQAATKVFDTFGHGYSSNGNVFYCIYGANNRNCVSGRPVAFKFSPGVSGALAYVDIAMFNIDGPQGATVTIVQDNGGSPKPYAPVIETMDVPKLIVCSTIPCPANKKQKIASKLHPVLTAGTYYWLVVYPSAYDTGNSVQLSPNQTGPVAFSYDVGKTWSVDPSDTYGAFDVFIQ